MSELRQMTRVELIAQVGLDHNLIDLLVVLGEFRSPGALVD